jgi:hypothetical protein
MNFKKLDKDIFISEHDRAMLEMVKPFYRLVSVSMRCEEIPSSIGWPFLPNNTIFGEPHDPKKTASISKKLEKMMRSNTLMSDPVVTGWNYYQLPPDQMLTPCIYKLIEGEWYYCLDPSVVQKVADQYGI